MNPIVADDFKEDFYQIWRRDRMSGGGRVMKMVLDGALPDDLWSGACCWRVPLLSSVEASKWKSSSEVTRGYRGPDVLQQILYQRRKTFRVLLSNK